MMLYFNVVLFIFPQNCQPKAGTDIYQQNCMLPGAVSEVVTMSASFLARLSLARKARGTELRIRVEGVCNQYMVLYQ